MTASSFEALFNQWYAALCRVSFRVVRDKDVAEDLVQEVFVKFWNRREFLPKDLEPKPYLYRAVMNASFDFVESRKKIVLPDPEELLGMEAHEHADHPILHHEAQEAVNQGLEELPPACKEVFILSRYEDMSYREIAEVMDISIKTVEAQMSKALKVLRKHLLPFLTVLLLIISLLEKNLRNF